MEMRVDANGIEVRRSPLAAKKRAVLTGDLLKDARVRMDPRTNGAYVAIEFDSMGAKLFEQVTAANVGRRFAIVLDNTIYSAPVIQERISGGSAQISGAFSAKEAADLAIVLRAGSLPAPVEIIQNVTVGPSLGLDSIHKGLLAGAAGVLLVMTFMGSLTDTVVVFDRTRENLGKWGQEPVASVFNRSLNEVLSRTIITSLTTFLAALALYLFGGEVIHDFALALVVGVAIATYSSIFVASPVVVEWHLRAGGEKSTAGESAASLVPDQASPLPGASPKTLGEFH